MNWPLMGETITFLDRVKISSFVMTTKRFTMGEKVKKFESEWSKWLGAKHSLFVTSGSTANTLLVSSIKELFKLKDGDKVLVPACTWVTNISPIFQCGLQPIFCDINLKNYSFDISEVEKIGKKHKDIKMIFVTHLLGFSAQNHILQKVFPNAIIIDDICESHGCLDNEGFKYGSKSLGATFSFYFGHHMSTIEGGMISTNNTELYDIMRMKRSHGMARESMNSKEYAEKYKNIESTFLFMTDGYNFRNHEICAVLGLSQLKRLDKMIEKRRRNYDDYVNLINKFSNLFYPHEYQEGNSSFCFPFICKNKNIANEMKKVFKKNQIEYRPIVSGNLLTQPFLLERSYKLETTKNISNVDILHDQGVYIGNSHFIGKKHMKLLLKSLEEVNENVG
jgi:CDP-6-deoxy-D-xylo-4-hexulose-3-dehydrase